MPKNAKDKIIDPEKIKQKRQKQLKKERQRIAKALEKLRAPCKRGNIEVIYGRFTWGLGSWKDLLRTTRIVEKLINRFQSFWAKNRSYINAHLCRCEHLFRPQEEKNEEDNAMWFNLEDVKTSTDLRECWKFIKEWKTYFHAYRELIKGEGTGRREQNIKTYYYMRHRGKELKNEGRNRKEIYKILSKEVTTIFGYCPGVTYQENGKIDTEHQTIQNASRLWHILGDDKYDSKEYKKFRVTHEEDGKKKTITLRTWYNKVKIKVIKKFRID